MKAIDNLKRRSKELYELLDELVQTFIRLKESEEEMNDLQIGIEKLEKPNF
jgi:hypothetical protein